MSNIFSGFSEATIEFLWNLRLNNDKAWFGEHENEYHEVLLKPAKQLVADLSGIMSGLDPFLEVTPAVNKTISRIHRDLRFTKDKMPYRDRLWITFKRRIENWQDSPGYFFEITPESYRFGMGFYQASKATMDVFREAVLENSDGFLETVSFLKKANENLRFQVDGERYKRLSLPEMPCELTEWFYLKNVYVVCNRPIDRRLFEKALLSDLEEGFNLIYPFYDYLWNIKALSNKNKEMIFA